RLRMDLASTRHRCVQRLGSSPVWAWDLVSALRVDVGRLRTMGMGSIPLRSLGLLQQFLGVVAPKPLLPQSRLVATGVSVNPHLLWQHVLLVSAELLPSRSALQLLSTSSRALKSPPL